MNIVLRVLIVLLVAPAAYYFIYWLPFSLIPLGGQRWIATLVSFLCAVGAGWFVWTRTRVGMAGAFSSMLYWAVVLGGIGFTAGFFGPIIFAPGANQGPLLGIFITGPLGFLVGAVVGLLRWQIRRKRDIDAVD